MHYVEYSTDDSFDSVAFARFDPDIFSPVSAPRAGWKSVITRSETLTQVNEKVNCCYSATVATTKGRWGDASRKIIGTQLPESSKGFKEVIIEYRLSEINLT